MTKPINDLSYAEVAALLSYDPDSGSLTWRVSRGTARAGDVAGTIEKQGYVVIGINRRIYKAHRLAWLLFYGAWPDVQVDHKDLNKTNNAISNLRAATALQNGCNKRKSSANSSGFKGVYYHSGSGKWRAMIRVCGVCHSLGLHDDIHTAAAAYAAAANDLHLEFARTA